MSKEVYLLKGGKATALQDMRFENEYELQKIIEENPNLLLRESDRKVKNKLFLVDREMTLPGTLLETTDLSLDHFMVDKFGVPVLVEVKLMSNQEIRRKVVGQMMEYAARISSFDSTELQELYTQRSGEEAPVEDSREFWKTVSSNLRASRLKLVFAADEIPTTLKMIIEMLDRTMRDVDVYGVEIQRHVDNGQVFLSTNYVLNTAKPVDHSGVIGGAGRRWSDRDAEDRLTANGQKWAFPFFLALREKCDSLGFVGRYGSAETYIPFRWYYDGSVLFSFDIGRSAGIYFNSKTIDIITKHVVPQNVLYNALSAIDPRARYAKSKKAVYFRTMIPCFYEDTEKQTLLFDLIEKIAKAASGPETIVTG